MCFRAAEASLKVREHTSHCTPLGRRRFCFSAAAEWLANDGNGAVEVVSAFGASLSRNPMLCLCDGAGSAAGVVAKEAKDIMMGASSLSRPVAGREYKKANACLMLSK